MRDELQRYATRGTPAGSDVVLSRAAEVASTPSAYVPDPTGRQRPWRAVAMVALVLLIAGLVSVLAAVLTEGSRSGRVLSDADDSSDTADAMTYEERKAEVEQHWASVEAGQWTRYSGEPGIVGADVPDGWVLLRSSADALREAAQSGIPVYDAPDGTVLGYDFANLGYVPKEVAEAPGFDQTALRAAKFGCDIVADPGCQDRLTTTLADD